MSTDPTQFDADAIAAKKLAEAAAATEAAPPEPTPALEAGPWQPELWRAGKWLVTRLVKQPNSPQLKREVYGSGRLGNYATPFESEESAQTQADKLNEGDAK